MKAVNGSVVVAEVRLIDGKCVGFYMDKKITEQHSVEKCLDKLSKYVKGQK